MSHNTKIGTLNLCLGLRSKKEEVKRLIIENDIDILCVQETEIPSSYPIELLTFKGYNYENENNDLKSRCGIYIKNNISYIRRHDLENKNLHVTIIDINDSKKHRIITLYRTFNPQNSTTQKQFFENQLLLISSNVTPNSIILGDFNLDSRKRNDPNYSHRRYFESLNNTFEPHNLVQVIEFETWTRIVNNVIKSSIIDHVYLKDPTSIINLSSTKPPFGDHELITFDVSIDKVSPKEIFKRNWKNYSKEKFIAELAAQDWNIKKDSVQSYWNDFESKVIETIDKLAPMQLISEIEKDKSKPPPHIKTKLNRRNRLLKKLKHGPPSTDIRSALKTLNNEIKQFFYNQKTSIVRRGILPGNSKSLWDAVKIAKNQNTPTLPDIMSVNEINIKNKDLPLEFAKFFSNKIAQITSTTQISNAVYNGTKKVNYENSFFMTDTDILESLRSIKIKNCEGFDRIPQRVLVDGAQVLVVPLKVLFQKIYYQNTLPEQWLISKITPIHKKGPKNKIENYRPIANLCSTSKLFERLILKQIQKIELHSNVDLSGKQQHGFKKCKSTSTLGLQIQSLIARALDDSNYVLMASVDLSAAFDVVNIDLLIERLRIIGLPSDVVDLIECWLKNRSFYVEVNGLNSMFYDINSGTIQGSILGPILYAIYVSPLFDLADLSNFADDNFALSWNLNKQTVIDQMQIKLKIITTWLRDSGLKVNEQKTELCLFYKRDTPPVEIIINNIPVKSATSMNVLGVSFDSKLTWTKQISNTINKANQALHAIKLIKKYFNTAELLQLLTSNFYSILYYNSEIWHIPNLKQELKQSLLSASANALKISQRLPDPMESFINVHKNCNRALPNQLMNFKHSILLHKLFNNHSPSMDWVELNLNQAITSRESNFNLLKSNKTKIGNNLLSNRLTILNKKVKLDDLNMSLDSFKIKYKKILLQTN